MVAKDTRLVFKKIQTLIGDIRVINSAILLIGITILAIFEIIGISSIFPFMSMVLNPSVVHDNEYLLYVYTLFNFQNQQSFVIFLGSLTLILLLMSNIASALMLWVVVWFSQKQGVLLSMRLLEQYVSRPYVFFLGRNSSDLSKNILTETQRCVDGVIYPLIYALSKALVALFILMLLFFANPSIAISVVVAAIFLYLIVYRLSSLRLEVIGNLTLSAVSNRYKIVSEALQGIKELKLKGAELLFAKDFKLNSENLADYTIRSTVIANLPKYFIEFVAFGGIVAVILFNLINGQNGSEIIPILSLYAAAGYRMLPAIQQIYKSKVTIKYNMPAVDMIIKDLESYSHTLTTKNEKRPIEFNHSIKLNSVSYCYPGSNVASVENINMTVYSDTTIGIVGATGSGKTTLVDIILGLLEPSSGHISVDNRKINQKNLRTWQDHLSYVPQSIFLVDDTIEKNIAFGVKEGCIDRDRVISAAKIAEIDEHIQTLPKKYQTIVGEKGVRISGGQLQRIGIARALYMNSSVLVFDEATSALDGITENAIVSSINKIQHKKTIFIIAHRLSTVKKCDVIYMLNKGKVIDSGTYEKLIKTNEKFRKMSDVA